MLYEGEGELMKQDIKKIFDEFLDDYLENVSKILPSSYRAQQMKSGVVYKKAVMIYETEFLKKPFMDAIKKLGKKALVFGEDGKLFSGSESPDTLPTDRRDDDELPKGELKPKEKRWIDAKVLHKDDSPCGHEIIQIGKVGFCPVCIEKSQTVKEMA